MPSSPAMRKLLGDDTVCHSAGCGRCTGFGTTVRVGMLSRSDSQLNSGSVHAATHRRAVSSSSASVASGSMPNVAHSAPPERARPSSTRPFERWSSTAARSATRSGWLILNGVSTPAWPTRMRSVCCAIAAFINSGAPEYENSGVQWCSTDHQQP